MVSEQKAEHALLHEKSRHPVVLLADPELAAYGFALAKNHGYVDGNKRVAFLISRTGPGILVTACAASGNSACSTPSTGVCARLPGALRTRPVHLLVRRLASVLLQEDLDT